MGTCMEPLSSSPNKKHPHTHHTLTIDPHTSLIVAYAHNDGLEATQEKLLCCFLLLLTTVCCLALLLLLEQLLLVLHRLRTLRHAVLLLCCWCWVPKWEQTNGLACAQQA